MSRYENLLKIKEIRRLVDIKEYKKAFMILNTMDVERIRGIAELNIFAEIYTQNGRIDDAMNTLLRIYEKSNTRRVLYQLVELSIKRKSIEEAEQFYEEYSLVASMDPNKFILRYKIDKEMGVSPMTLIHSLEALKELEYDEKWALELAKQYHRAGLNDQCIRECSDIILWFGEGLYVEKAQQLKDYYTGNEQSISTVNDQIDKIVEQDSEDIKIQELSESLEKCSEINENDGTNCSPKENKNLFSTKNEDISEVDDMDYLSNLLANNVGDISTIYEENKSYKSLEESEANNELDESIFNNELDESGFNNGLDESESYNELDESESYNELDESGFNNELDESGFNNELDERESYNGLEENEFVENKLESKSYNLPEIETQDDTTDTEENKMVEETQKEINYISNKEDYISQQEDIIIDGVNLNKIFKSFFDIEGVKEDILRCLTYILNNKDKRKHFIITGYKSSGKTELGKMISRWLFKQGILRTSKVAKISASKMNVIDLEANMVKLMDGVIIIERACELLGQTIKEVINLIEKSKERIIIILEDDENGMNTLASNNPCLGNYFSNCIKIPDYTKENLMCFSYHYVEKNEFDLEMESKEVLSVLAEKINEMCDYDSKLKTMMECIDYAILKAEARNETKLKEMIQMGEYKKVSRILKPSDFIED